MTAAIEELTEGATAAADDVQRLLGGRGPRAEEDGRCAGPGQIGVQERAVLNGRWSVLVLCCAHRCVLVRHQLGEAGGAREGHDRVRAPPREDREDGQGGVYWRCAAFADEDLSGDRSSLGRPSREHMGILD